MSHQCLEMVMMVTRIERSSLLETMLVPSRRVLRDPLRWIRERWRGESLQPKTCWRKLLRLRPSLPRRRLSAMFLHKGSAWVYCHVWLRPRILLTWHGLQ
jgi:hypothetical protein